MKILPRVLSSSIIILVMVSCSNATRTVEPAKQTTPNGLPRTGNQAPGLELVTWHVLESDSLDGSIIELSEPAFEEKTTQRLARNGLTITKLPEARIPELINSLGGTNAAMSTWCGQVTDWRHLRDVHVQHAIVEIDEEDTLLDGGKLGLAARAWVEPSLEGARMRMELVPRFKTDRRPRASILNPTPTNIHVFSSLAEWTDVLPGEVLLVTSTSPPPLIEPLPPVEETPAGDDPDPTDDPALDTPIPRTRKDIDRSIELGHALFEIRGEIPERVMLVLVPRIPQQLIPPPAGSSLQISADRGTSQ